MNFNPSPLCLRLVYNNLGSFKDVMAVPSLVLERAPIFEALKGAYMYIHHKSRWVDKCLLKHNRLLRHKIQRK